MKWFSQLGKYLGKVRSSPEAVPDAQSSAPVPSNPNEKYRDPVYLALVDQCAMGDIVAMMDLARWHRQHAPREPEQLLSAYEQDPEARQALDEWFYRNRYGSDDFHIRCYITWVCRAALYGNPEAEVLTERCSFFPRWSLIPQKLYQPGGFSSQLFYSFELKRLGLKGVSENLEEFAIYPLMKEGIFRAYFLADYIPADEDGFGREDDYEDIFYDEFFNCTPADTIAQAREAVAKLVRKRRDYWDDPAHDREHRMYKRLLSEEA